MSLDYALALKEQPDNIVKFPTPCPQHIECDESRLDHRRAGYTGQRCMEPKCKGRPVFRVSVLCDVLHVEHWCEKHLPKYLRKLLCTT